MRVHKLLACLALVLCLPYGQASAAFAQSTTGSISGTVIRHESALPGATITVVHGPTSTRYTTSCDKAGRFRIPNVRAGGPYTATVSGEGLPAWKSSVFFVKLGEDLHLPIELAVFEESVEVVAGELTPGQSRRTGASAAVSTEELETLPTIGRGLADMVRTQPFFEIDFESGDITVAGRNNRYNNVTIDGSLGHDTFSGAGTPGRAGGPPISLDAIQEVQLVTAPFDVRQGGFTGGGINAVTRSGSNELSGSLFFFNRSDGLVGGGPDELGDFDGFEEEQAGFRLGGPIVREKIFFFVNAEIEQRATPTGWSIDGSGGRTFMDGEAGTDAERLRDLLTSRYGFDPGGLGQATRDDSSVKLFGRLDLHLGRRHSLSLRHNFVDAVLERHEPSSRVFWFPSRASEFALESHSTVLELHGILRRHLFNELRVARQSSGDARTSVLFPWIEIENVAFPGSRREFEAGSDRFSGVNDVDQAVVEIHDDLTWLAGAHTVTFGTHNELLSFDNLVVPNPFGSYEFTTLDDLEAGIARRFRYSFANPGQDPTDRFSVSQLGAYVGDQWTARPNLTLIFGLRLDVPFFSEAPERNPVTEELYGLATDRVPDGEELLSPRFGFNWAVAGDGKQQLRGGAGLFAGRIPYVWFSNLYSYNGLVTTDIEASNVPFNPDPFNQPREVGGASVQSVNLIDPDFELPQILRANLAYEHQLPWHGLIGSLEVLYDETLSDIDIKNVNLVPTGEVRPFDGRPLYTRVSQDFGAAFFVTNTGQGSSTHVAVKLERPYAEGLWGRLSYTYGDARVVYEGTRSLVSSNWLSFEARDPNNVRESTADFEIRHRFNLSISYRFHRARRYSTTLSAVYDLRSGQPYSTILDSTVPSVNGDGYVINDPVYVPAGPGEAIFAPDGIVVTVSDPGDPRFADEQAAAWAALDAYVEGDRGLRRHRGAIVPRNASLAPWNHTLDLHVAQQIPLRRSRLELTLDVLNLVNLLDKDSGVLRLAGFGNLAPWTFVGVDEATERPVYRLDRIVTDPEANPKFEIRDLRSRWRAKLGIRWSF